MFKEEIDGCKDNLKVPLQQKQLKIQNITPRFSISAMSSIKRVEIKHDVNRGNFAPKVFVNPQDST